MCENWSSLCVPACAHTYVWHMGNNSVSSVIQTPHIMLQCGRNYVGAFLPHHEVPLWWPAELQQRPLHPVQGESQPVLLIWTGGLPFLSLTSLCLNADQNLTFSLNYINVCMTKITLIYDCFSFHRVTLLRPCTPCGLKLASWRRASCSVCATLTPTWRATQPL